MLIPDSYRVWALAFANCAIEGNKFAIYMTELYNKDTELFCEVLTRWLKEPRKIRVYVAAPYTKGDTALNVRNAILAADKLLELGYSPFVPHLMHLWHYISPKPEEEWLEVGQEWLKVCDALLRLPGPSLGADREIEIAESLGIPVFYSVEVLHEKMPPISKILLSK